MECSICFNAITSATGKVELSCSHPFHFSCLTTWFDKQKIQGGCENCPLCRHEANEFEKMPAGPENEEDEEDDDETWDADDEEPTLDELAAQERARHRFARYKLINPIKEVELYAANLIKACWRGYQDRLLFQELLANKEDADYSRRMIEENKVELVKLLSREKFLKATIGLSRTQVKHLASAKIQVLWRWHKVQAGIGSVSGIWRKTGISRWEKIILNPEEHEPATIHQPPSTLV
jgi:hypothetical protein